MKICFMVGHRDTNMGLYPNIEKAVNFHIAEYDIDEFIIGHYGNFDCMAVTAVKSAKAIFPKVKMTLLRPYLDYYPLPEGFDGSLYPDGLESVPKRFAILRANYKVIDKCDYVIAYVRYSFGGAYRCMEYAKRKNKPVFNICKDGLL